LLYYRDGKLHRISADTCDEEKAEAKAREMMAAFEAAAKGEPTAGTRQKLRWLLVQGHGIGKLKRSIILRWQE
jgi:hypothetical protein